MSYRMITRIGGIAVLAGLIAAPGIAAEPTTTIRVALTDMSSAISDSGGRWGGGQTGPGWGMGPGMMGGGMMGRGWAGPGQGPGGGAYQGWGMGPGMMGPGGMMGHGMMAIRVDNATVKAGEVHFDVTNWSRGMLHEMLVIRVDSANAPLPYDYNKAEVDENQVKVLGDTESLQPNESKQLTLNLKAGTYLLVCNLPGHYAAGMVTTLTVTP